MKKLILIILFVYLIFEKGIADNLQIKQWNYNISNFNRLNNCEIKFATIGHFYSINKRTYRNLDGKESTKYFNDYINQLVKDLNREYLDVLILLGDITQKGNIDEEWEILKNFTKRLNTKVLYVPGNHEYSNDKSIEYFNKNIGYTSAKKNINGCNLYLLNSNNTNLREEKYHNYDLSAGLGLDDNSINLLKSLNPDEFNILFMHHNLYSSEIWHRNNLGLYSRETLNTLHPAHEIPKKAEKKWYQEVYPLIKNKVRFIYAGDYHNKRPSVMTKNNITYVASGFRFVEDSSIAKSGKGPLNYNVTYIKNNKSTVYQRFLILPENKIQK